MTQTSVIFHLLLLSVNVACDSALVTEPPGVGDIVAQQIRTYRQAKGWSIRELSEACAKYGAVQLTQSSLANIERGRDVSAQRKGREVSVDELLALAVVLGVPPMALLLPVEDDADRASVTTVQVTPTVAASWYIFAGWLRAQWGLSHDLSANQNSKGWRVKNFFLVMDRYTAAADDEADLHRRMIQQQVRPDSPEILRAAESMYEGTVSRFVEALKDMLDHGLVPPRPYFAPRIIENYRKAGYQLRPDIEALFAAWESTDAGR